MTNGDHKAHIFYPIPSQIKDPQKTGRNMMRRQFNLAMSSSVCRDMAARFLWYGECEIITIRHECPCRIEISHQRG